MQGVYYPPQQPGQQPPAYLNNGQLYGGAWRPPYHPHPQQYGPPGARPLPGAPGMPPPPQQAQGAAQPQPQPGGAAAAAAPPAPSQELTQTATIRNAVNLKKNTLAVTPVPGAPGRLAISFTFDASQPCAVTTFVAATEEPARGCRLTPALQQPAPPVYYEKGVSCLAGPRLARRLGGCTGGESG